MLLLTPTRNLAEGCGRFWNLIRRRNDCMIVATGCLLEHTMMWFQGTLQSLAHVPQGVPAIGYLNRLRQGPTSGLKIGAGTIPADDLRTRMLPQPCSHGLGFAVGEQVDDRACL